MKIVTKTAEEFWRDKVSIQISGTADEVQTVGQHLVRGRQVSYWADACEKAENRVRELEQDLATSQQAREIETKRANDADEKLALYDVDRHTERDRADRNARRISELETSLARYVKAHVCTDRCQPNAHVAFEGNSLVAGLEAELADALTRIGELDGQLRKALEEQRRRFTEAEVDTAKEGARADERARLDREVIHPLNTKLSRIHSAVLGTELARELAEYREASAATLLVEALSEVRRITGVTSV